MTRARQRRPIVTLRVHPHDTQAVVEYERATLGGDWIWMSICGAIFIAVFLVPLFFAFPTWYMVAIIIAAVCLLILYVIAGLRNR